MSAGDLNGLGGSSGPPKLFCERGVGQVRWWARTDRLSELKGRIEVEVRRFDQRREVAGEILAAQVRLSG